MEARQKKVLDLFSVTDTKFSIPVYQRDYNWEEKQCKTLLKDIKMVAETDTIISHFIGSIVYLHEGIYNIGSREFSIIDGQQRLTTITILLIALCHRLGEFNESEKRDMIYKRYLIDEYIKDSNKMKLIPAGINLRILKLILENKIDELKDGEKESNLFINYKFFFESLDSKEKTLTIIKGLEKLIYVEISLEKGKDDPQRIFESLNSTGLDLSQSDLIRNFILMDLDRETQDRVYEEYWIIMEENCKTGEKSKIVQLLSDFIRDYLTFKLQTIPTKGRVFEEFKINYESLSKEELEKELSEIKEYSYLYRNILNPEKESNKTISKHLKYLKILDSKVINPFLIAVYMDYKKMIIDEKCFLDILKLIQSYLWRRYICEYKTNDLNKIFTTLYKKIEKDNYYGSLESYLATQKFPTNKILKENLKIKQVYKDTRKLKYVFERIENENHNEKIDFDEKNITLEHIFPQTPSKKWKEKFSEIEFEKMESLKNTIANITVTGSNSNLGNKSFNEKRDMEYYGYRDSKFLLNKWIASQNEWNTAKLDERFDIIFDYIIKIWKAPVINETVKNIEEMIFYCKGPRSNATGTKLNNNKFKVFKGSKASKEFFNEAKKSNQKIVDKLIDEEIIVEYEEYYQFVEDYIFSSPSSASKFILGRSSNGLVDWKTYEGEILGNYKN